MKAYPSYDAVALAELIRRREVSAAEVLEAAIARRDAVNPQINAISARHDDLARRRLAERPPEGAFAGVPFLLKDVGAQLAGTVTSNCARLWQDAAPALIDSTLVARYQAAGLVIFGKTTAPELAVAASTESSRFGTTRNPWDLSRSPGGSSGGAAAAVAAGIVPVAAASDGGGSIRIPASCCGLFGLKPTRARTPSGPYVGEGWGSLACAHVLSRSVRDSAALLDATAGPAPGDPYAAPAPSGPWAAEVGRDPGRLRIGLQRQAMNGVQLSAATHAATEETVALLLSLGHEVEEITLPGDPEALTRAVTVLVGSNVSRLLHQRAAALGRALRPEDVDRAVWNLAEAGSAYPVESYSQALNDIHWQGRLMADLHQSYDVILSPTLARHTMPLGPMHTDNPDQAAYLEALAQFAAFTQTANMTGQPSMSVPLCWGADGLPIGMMFTGPYGREDLLLRLAGQLEAVRPWAHLRPSLAP